MDDKYKNEFGVFAPRPKVEKKFYDGKYIFAGQGTLKIPVVGSFSTALAFTDEFGRGIVKKQLTSRASMNTKLVFKPSNLYPWTTLD